MTRQELDRKARAIINASLGGGEKGTGITVGFETLYEGIRDALKETERAAEARAVRFAASKFGTIALRKGPEEACRCDRTRRLRGAMTKPIDIDELRQAYADAAESPDPDAAQRKVDAAFPIILDELEAAREFARQAHKLTGRGDGHGSMGDTASCVISGILDLKEAAADAAELEKELEAARAWIAAIRDWAIQLHFDSRMICAVCRAKWPEGEPEQHDEGCLAAAEEWRNA